MNSYPAVAMAAVAYAVANRVKDFVGCDFEIALHTVRSKFRERWSREVGANTTEVLDGMEDVFRDAVSALDWYLGPTPPPEAADALRKFADRIEEDSLVPMSEAAARAHIAREARMEASRIQSRAKRRPTISVICGSTKQRKDFEALTARLTLKGHIVLSVGLFGHETGLDMDGPVKKALDELHLRKIDLADEAHFIMKPGGLMGESTAREHGYATRLGKKIVLHSEGLSDDH